MSSGKSTTEGGPEPAVSGGRRTATQQATPVYGRTLGATHLVIARYAVVDDPAPMERETDPRGCTLALGDIEMLPEPSRRPDVRP